MNPGPVPNPSTPLTFKMFLDALFVNTWPWWVAGLCLGVTVIFFAWYAGRKMGASSGYADACRAMGCAVARKKFDGRTDRLWFLLGLPLGAFLATCGWWTWTWTLGRMDMVTNGNFFVKVILLLLGGLCLGFGARWTGGCMTSHGLFGVPLGHKMSLISVAAFLASGFLLAYILLKVL